MSWLSFSFLLLLYVSSWVFSGVSLGVSGFVSPYVCFDSVCFSLVFLTVVISVFVLVLGSWVSFETLCLVILSQASSVVCYFCCHVLLFWVFYEVSIISLSFLLMKYSPYSERFVSFWYFWGYILFCSLPMLLIFIGCSLCWGSCSILSWGVVGGGEDSWVVVLLCLLFVTKIPLFPFHSWLPVVHAESSSVVSVCLSGYVMKLGVLGVFRFGHWVLPGYFFCDLYVGVVLLVSLVLLVCCSQELDSKRWLAFLSLSHMCLVPISLCVVEGFGCDVIFSYCLGHGLSSCISFVYFWFGSLVGGGRSWMSLKAAILSGGGWEFVCVYCFCVCGSFPPSVQFFCELALMSDVGYYGGVVFYLLWFYLFLGALVVLVCMGYFVVRYFAVLSCGAFYQACFSVLGFLGVWGVFCFFYF